MNTIKDSLVITKRQLLQLARVPEVLIFSTIQPVMFVLLFRYVFGGSIETGQPGGYVQLLMPGIFVQTVAFTLAATASGLAEDMKKGLIDRFRSLPISRSALIVGRTLGDSLLNIVVLAVMGIAGYIVGWRPTSGVFSIILAFLFLLFFGYALSWVGIQQECLDHFNTLPNGIQFQQWLLHAANYLVLKMNLVQLRAHSQVRIL